MASRHLRDVRRTIGRNARDLVRQIERSPQEARLEKLTARAEAGTFEAKLAASLTEVTDPLARVAAANEALGELAFVLDSRARWSPTAGRLALWGTFLLTLLAVFERALFQAYGVMACGVIAVFAAHVMKKRTQKIEREGREVADALVRTMLPGAAQRRRK